MTKSDLIDVNVYPRCEDCKMPFIFEIEEPFAYCDCGTTEWGDPRPNCILYVDEVTHAIRGVDYEDVR